MCSLLSAIAQHHVCEISYAVEFLSDVDSIPLYKNTTILIFLVGIFVVHSLQVETALL